VRIWEEENLFAALSFAKNFANLTLKKLSQAQSVNREV